MNSGHVEWCLNKRKNAIDLYMESINQDDNDLNAFLIGFEEDKPHLIKNGVKPEEIPFMIDYLKYMLEK